MFIALDKLANQGIKKVIVAVPEKSIGASFEAIKLTEYGFFTDWNPNPKYNLCTPVSEYLFARTPLCVLHLMAWRRRH